MNDQDDRFEQLWKWAFGNGSKGADERLNNAEKKLDDMHSTLKALEKAERRRSQEELADRKARRAFMWGAAAVVVIMGAGGIRFALWLTEQIGAITRLLGVATP